MPVILLTLCGGGALLWGAYNLSNGASQSMQTIAGGIEEGANNAENTVASGVSSGVAILAVAAGAALLLYTYNKSK